MQGSLFPAFRVQIQPSAPEVPFPTVKTRVPESWAHGQDLLPIVSEGAGARGPQAGSRQVKRTFLSPPQTTRIRMSGDEASNLRFHLALQGILRPVLTCTLQLL